MRVMFACAALGQQIRAGYDPRPPADRETTYADRMISGRRMGYPKVGVRGATSISAFAMALQLAKDKRAQPQFHANHAKSRR
jgi:hypothetical protein